MSQERDPIKNLKDGQTLSFKPLLDKLFHDASHPAGYSSANTLFSYAKQVDPSIKFKDILSYLDKENTYSSFKLKNHKFKRRKIEISYPDEIWAIDTFFLISLSKQNSGYKLVLICVDSFSRFMHTRPLKTKEQQEVRNAFRSIISENRNKSPLYAFTDKGSDLNFLNHSFQEFEITRYSSNNSSIKSSQAERSILTLKRFLFRAMFHEKSLRWVDLLGPCTLAYNLRKTKNLFGFSPTEAKSPENTKKLQVLFEKRKIQYESQFYDKKNKFKVGDVVKIKIPLTQFSRGYKEQFSPETYRVVKIKKTFPTTYRLNTLKKSYYESEIVHANETHPSLFIAETKNEPIMLRSGKVANAKNSERYKIKDHNNPSYKQWVTYDEAKRLNLLD